MLPSRKNKPRGVDWGLDLVPCDLFVVVQSNKEKRRGRWMGKWGRGEGKGGMRRGDTGSGMGEMGGGGMGGEGEGGRG